MGSWGVCLVFVWCDFFFIGFNIFLVFFLVFFYVCFWVVLVLGMVMFLTCVSFQVCVAHVLIGLLLLRCCSLQIETHHQV